MTEEERKYLLKEKGWDEFFLDFVLANLSVDVMRDLDRQYDRLEWSNQYSKDRWHDILRRTMGDEKYIAWRTAYKLIHAHQTTGE